jgi:hypothetical protein
MKVGEGGGMRDEMGANGCTQAVHLYGKRDRYNS